MQKLYNSFKFITCTFLLCFGVMSAYGQSKSFTPGDLTYTENFDGIGVAGTAFPTGWGAFDQDDDSELTTLGVTTGSTSSGNIYNVGTDTDADRAIGTLSSGSTQPSFGTSLENTTGDNILQLDFDFNLEQWKSGSSETADEVVMFEYSLDASSINDGTATWVTVSELDLNEIQTTTESATAIDGNDVANKINITHSLAGLSFADNSTIFIRWSDANDGGSDGMYAIDDLSITAVNGVPPAPSTSVAFVSSSASVTEVDGTYNLDVAIENPDAGVATSVDVVLTSGDANDIDSYTTQTLTFAAGSSANETATITITDDGVYTERSDLTFTLQNVVGGTTAIIGANSTFILTIDDNELPLGVATIPFSETFDTDLSGVYTYSVSGNTKEWQHDNGVASMNGFNSGELEEDWLILPGFNLNLTTTEILSFDSEYQYGGEDANNFLKLLYSTDYSGVGNPSSATWTELTYTAPGSSETLTSSGNIDLSSISGTQVYIAFQYYYTNYRSWKIDNISITESVPAVIVTESLTDFGSVDNAAVSATQNFTVEGADLTDDILITAPANFEVSLTDVPADFGTSVTLTQAGGAVASTTVYVRFAPSTGVNQVISDDIVINTAGATNEVITVSGTETGNAAPTADLFFSEYIEGNGNNRAIEIYNNSGADVDLSNYTIKQSPGGAGFDLGDPAIAYSLPLSGNLPAGEVYIIFNNGADAEIIGAGDLGFDYGGGVGQRIPFFTGDDALGLFKNGVLIDIIGDPSNDPGSGWDVAGTVGATADHTLVRKPSITVGNQVALASFGTTEMNSEWIVLDQDDFTNTGFHTIDGVASPDVTIVETLTDFGDVDNGAVSATQNFTVEGADLTDDILITAPAHFEVSLTDVSADFGTSVTLTQTGGAVASTTVYVRFSPSTGINQTISEDLTVNTAGATNQVISVSGSETGNDPLPESNIFITEIADPNNDLGLRFIELYNAGDEAVDFTEGNGWRMDKYTNASTEVSQTLSLTGSIPAKGFYIIAAGEIDTDFETAYGVAPDQFDEDGTGNGVAGSNGDDNLELYNGADVLIDQFGVPGVKGTDQNHEFEDGRAERKATVVQGNPTWDVAEWNIDNDGSLFPGSGEQNAPEDFDPGAWIGTGGPLITIDETAFAGGFGGVTVGVTASASSFQVTGSDLEAVITVIAPEGFMVSLDNTTFTATVELPQNSTDADVFVNFTPAEEKTYTGNITLTSTNATDKSVAVSGTGLSGDVIYFEDFANCDIENYTTFSVSGDDKVWSCNVNGQTGEAVRMNGFDFESEDLTNEDWLITPLIDLSVSTSATMTFFSDVAFSVDFIGLEVLASSDYTGTGDPTIATWTTLNALLDANDDNDTWTNSGDVDLADFVGGNVYVAFKYTSSTTAAPQWTIDDVLIEERAAVPNPAVTVTADLADFGSVENGAVSVSQSFTVAGANLTSDITITSPANFEISLDDATFSETLALTANEGAVASTTVHIRFAPNSGINDVIGGNVVLSTENAVDQTIAVTGTETGNEEITGDLFFSEYVEGNGNNRAIEIFNGTGADVDLSAYSVKQSHNGVGFGNDAVAEAYDLPLTGTLANGDVYVIYNADATRTEITTEGDLPLAYGDTDGLRIASFTGDDALGLFKGGVLIDLIGDASNDPGSGWDVAGEELGTVDHVLVRKSIITTGNINPLGSFGTSEDNSEWIVLDSASVSGIGSHTVEIPVAEISIDDSNFNADFGQVKVGDNSAVSVYTVSGTELTDDVTITVTGDFEISLTSDFAVVGNASTPLVVESFFGELETTQINVRFVSTSVGTKTGTITHATTGVDNVVINVSGEGTEEAVTAIDPSILKEAIKMYPNPIENGEMTLSLDNQLGEVVVRVLALDGSELQVQKLVGESTLKLGALQSGMYIINLSNEDFNENYRIVVK